MYEKQKTNISADYIHYKSLLTLNPKFHEAIYHCSFWMQHLNLDRKTYLYIYIDYRWFEFYFLMFTPIQSRQSPSDILKKTPGSQGF